MDPDILTYNLNEFEKQYVLDNPSKQHRSTGYYSMWGEDLARLLKRLKREGTIKEGADFLDLGSGMGKIVVVAASEGLNAYGIEINEYLHDASKELMEFAKEREILDGTEICKTFQGSYFPNDYIKHRNNGGVLAQVYEKNDKIKVGDSKMKVFFPEKNEKDIYETIGKPIHEFDIVYTYCWRPNLASVTEMFANYAKEDALFLFSSAGRPTDFKELVYDLNLKAGLLSGDIYDPTTIFGFLKKKKPGEK